MINIGNLAEILNDENIRRLGNHLLFSGLSDEDIRLFIAHSNSLYKHISTGESMYIGESTAQMLTLLLSGSVYVYSTESSGNRSIIKIMRCDNINSTFYAPVLSSVSFTEFKAADESDLLFIDPQSVLKGEKSLITIQHKILSNIVSSQRKIHINQSKHLICLAQRSIKEKILKFLELHCQSCGSYEVTIPFSREELANYLSVDRASLSRELGVLKHDGAIDFKKNHFVILKTELFDL